MSWTKQRKVGFSYASPDLTSEGYTLFGSVRGKQASLIDMQGQIVHRWRHEEGIQYPRLLPNGNLLLHTSPEPHSSEADRIGGSAAALVEMDWDGNVVWEYRNKRQHHDFVRLPNGNHLILFIEELPDGMTEKVKGGQYVEDDPEVMWGDTICEVTPDGEVVYKWCSWEHLDFDEDVICPLETRKEWTHTNALSLTPDGDMLISLRGISDVAIVDRETAEFKWKWGREELSHQHCPTFLDSGKILIFDNGPHRFKRPAFSQVLEVDPANNEIGWCYKADPLVAFDSFAISGAERLANGNTLICEGVHGRFFEVTPEYEVVWEYLNPFFDASRYGRTSSVFRAHRYEPDFPGLQGKILDPSNYAELNELINGGLYASDGGIIEDPPSDEDEEETENGNEQSKSS